MTGKFEDLAGLDEGGAAGSVIERADGGEGFGVGVAEVEAREGVESLAGENGDGVGRRGGSEGERDGKEGGGGNGQSGRRCWSGLLRGEAGGGCGGSFGGAGEGVARGEFDVGVIPGDELEGEDGEDERGGKAEPFGVGGRFDFVFQCGEGVSVGRRFSVGEGFTDDGGVNLLFASDESERKRAERNCVYFARDAAGGLSDEGDGFGGANILISAAGGGEAVLNVVGDFERTERLDVGERGDALAKLLERGRVEAGGELGLAGQDDLDELAVFGFKVGDEAEHFENGVVEILGFVDDEDDAFAEASLFGEEVFEAGVEDDGIGVGGNAEVGDEVAKHFGGPALGLENEGGGGVAFEGAHEVEEESGFSHSGNSSEADETAAGLDGPDERGEGFAVGGAGIEEVGVGRVAERIRGKLEEIEKRLHFLTPPFGLQM